MSYREDLKLLIFLRAYNEEKTIGDVLDGVKKVTEDLKCETEIVVVDDCSSDSTTEIARSKGVEVIEHPRNLGPGAAVQTAYKYSVRNGFDVTLSIDADGQHPPEDIPRLLEPIFNDEADIVIGSRYKEDTDYETSPVRSTGIKFFSWFVSIVTGKRVYDLTSGFRAVRIEMGKDHAKNMPSGIHAINRGIREGLSDSRIKEVRVEMNQRDHGSSFLSPIRLLKYPFHSIYSFLNVLIRGDK